MKRISTTGRVHGHIGKLAFRPHDQVVRDCMEKCQTIPRPELGEPTIGGEEDYSIGLVNFRVSMFKVSEGRS